eukprot:COSAG01_NODE_494_length_16322_cov_35.380879_4_plen_177_part_00
MPRRDRLTRTTPSPPSTCHAPPRSVPAIDRWRSIGSQWVQTPWHGDPTKQRSNQTTQNSRNRAVEVWWCDGAVALRTVRKASYETWHVSSFVRSESGVWNCSSKYCARAHDLNRNRSGISVTAVVRLMRAHHCLSPGVVEQLGAGVDLRHVVERKHGVDPLVGLNVACIVHLIRTD